MKNYQTIRFEPGFQYESAQSRFEKFLADKKRYKTFEIIAVSIEQVRESWQGITVVFSTDTIEEELFETKENLQQTKDCIVRLLENEDAYKQRREYHMNQKAGKKMDLLGNVIEEESEIKQ